MLAQRRRRWANIKTISDNASCLMMSHGVTEVLVLAQHRGQHWTTPRVCWEARGKYSSHRSEVTPSDIPHNLMKNVTDTKSHSSYLMGKVKLTLSDISGFGARNKMIDPYVKVESKSCENQYCWEPPCPRSSLLGLRPPGLEFRILCLEDSVISFISPSSGGSPCPV